MLLFLTFYFYSINQYIFLLHHNKKFQKLKILISVDQLSSLGDDDANLQIFISSWPRAAIISSTTILWRLTKNIYVSEKEKKFPFLCVFPFLGVFPFQGDFLFLICFCFLVVFPFLGVFPLPDLVFYRCLAKRIYCGTRRLFIWFLNRNPPHNYSFVFANCQPCQQFHQSFPICTMTMRKTKTNTKIGNGILMQN